MLLSKLFKGAPDFEIEQLSVDSRVPMKNCIFFCLDGIKYDGHDYIEEAIKNGAKVIVHSKTLDYKPKAIMIKVNDVHEVMKRTANIFYNNPNEGIDKYIIAGNYGRCSVASFINYYLNIFSNCGYIGILGIKYNKINLKSSFPTQNGLDNLKILNAMRRDGVKSVTMEASASSLNLQKLDTVIPDTFIYTCTDKESSEFQSNDYYNNLRKYLYTLENNTKVILNIDDDSYSQINDCVGAYVSYGTSTIADYQIRDISMNKEGISFKIVYKEKAYSVTSTLQGLSNIYNLTAAIVALNEKGYELEHIIKVMAHVPDVDGVMERVDKEYDIIVDCAYDIKPIEELLKYAKHAAHKSKAIGVIGINYTDGDKRIEKIVNLAEKYLDVIIFTENESLEGEVMEILERADKFSHSGRIMHCSNRSLAIENAIELMNKKDVLVIVGKGNENYLTMGLGKQHYYGDKHYAIKYLEKRRREENALI